eukprot:COSAG01_NODE_2252_length_8074_cov_37.778809_4_plen_323_part_00
MAGSDCPAASYMFSGRAVTAMAPPLMFLLGVLAAGARLPRAGHWVCPSSVPVSGRCLPHAAGRAVQNFSGDAAACCVTCHSMDGSAATTCAAFTWHTHDGGSCIAHPAHKPLGAPSRGGCTSGVVRPELLPPSPPSPGPPPTPPPSPTPPHPPPPPRPCPAAARGVGYPLAPTMRGSVKTGFDGSFAACCGLCWATLASLRVGCVAFTHTDDACLLHPANGWLSPAGRWLGNRTTIQNATGVASGVTQPCRMPHAPVPEQQVVPAPSAAKNVLLLVSDDMRPEMLQAYGRSQMITPNFDALAAQSMVFRRAYCQQAICAPSR